MRTLRFFLLLFSLIGTVHAQAAPRSGTDVLRRMHDAYAGKWYNTLTFVQRTTVYKADGTSTESTWYESLRNSKTHGVQLRIDQGDPKIGNGVLYTADSVWIMRAGNLAAARAGGNVFLPLIEGVYVNSVEQTIRELKETGVDLTKICQSVWQDRPVWIIGVTVPTDSVTPQIWVDPARNVVVRVILSPAPSQPMMDIHLDAYVPLAGGWLATKIAMTVGGKPRQLEEYRDWKAGLPLNEDLFDTSKWTTAVHWVP